MAHLVIGFHLLVHQIRGIDDRGMAAIDCPGNLFKGLMGMAPAQVGIDVSRIGINLFSAFRFQHIRVNLVILRDNLPYVFRGDGSLA